MNVKKRFAFLITILFTLFLVACGGGEEEIEQENGDTTDGAETTESADKITIFQSKVEISEQLEALAEEYEEETGVEVEVWGTTGDDYFQQLQIRMNSNQGPSIFTLGHITEAERLDSYTYDFSNEDFVDQIAPGMEFEVNDKLVGLPYGVEGFGLIYNTDLVSEEDIADYDSFVNTLESFNDSDINGFTLAQDAYFLIGHLSNYPFSLQEDNAEFIEQMNNGEVTMAETEEFQAFGDLMEVIRANTPNPLDISYDEQIGDFASGNTAMIHQGNWAYGMLEDFDIDFEYEIAPLPLADNDKLAVGVGQNWTVNADKDEAEVQAAVDFLEWLYTSETGNRYIVEEFGFIPAFTNVETGDLDPLSEAVSEATNSGETIPWSHNLYPTNLIVNDFTPTTQNFFLNEEVTGEEFIDSLDESWQNAVN